MNYHDRMNAHYARYARMQQGEQWLQQQQQMRDDWAYDQRANQFAEMTDNNLNGMLDDALQNDPALYMQMMQMMGQADAAYYQALNQEFNDGQSSQKQTTGEWVQDDDQSNSKGNIFFPKPGW